MIRSLYLFAIVTVLALVGVWLSENPGTVSLRWDTYVIETNVVVLLAAALVLAILVAFTILFTRWIIRSPGKIGGIFSSRQRARGFDAISHGMVAIASGNAEEARKAAVNAEKYLGSEAMTLLLAAQASELNNDERAAEIYYTKMTERQDTELLGLRGLAAKAKRAGSLTEALEIVQKAEKLKPNTEWVIEELLDLHLKSGKYAEALAVLEKGFKGRKGREPRILHLKAALHYEVSKTQRLDGNVEAANTQIRISRQLDPAFIPAAMDAIKYAPEDRKRDKLIAQIWAKCPSPEIGEVIRELAVDESDADWYSRAKRLLEMSNKDHPETCLVLAKAAIAAREWGQVRSYLNTALEARPTAEVYRLLAELEEKANADASAAREWIMKIADADPDPKWTCSNCGDKNETWQFECRSCHSYAKSDWQTFEATKLLDTTSTDIARELPEPV